MTKVRQNSELAESMGWDYDELDARYNEFRRTQHERLMDALNVLRESVISIEPIDGDSSKGYKMLANVAFETKMFYLPPFINQVIERRE